MRLPLRRLLGDDGADPIRIGYGPIHWSLHGVIPPQEAGEMLRAAIAMGIPFVDTADAYYAPPYAPHANERLIAEALGPSQRAHVVIGTKGGTIRPEGRWVLNNDPDHLRRTIRESFLALGGDRPIDLWQLHGLDRTRDMRAQLMPAVEAVAEGLVTHVGLSNVSAAEIARARDIVEIVSVQNRFSLWDRRAQRDGTLAYCEREGLTFLCWSPLGGPGGPIHRGTAAGLCKLATERDTTAACLAVAWLLAKGSCVVPIVGSRNLGHLAEVIGATRLSLSVADQEAIQYACAVSN